MGVTLADIPYYPFVIAAVIAGCLLIVVCVIICCKRYHVRQRKKLDGVFSNLQPNILATNSKASEKMCLYPYTATSPITGATLIQPDAGSLKPLASAVVYGLADSSTSSSSGSGTPANGSGTPVHTPPVKNKKGLLGSRRGSAASLTLDLRSFTQPEPGAKWGSPPRECTTEEYLASATNKLSRAQLRLAVVNTKALQEEFLEIPMNHVSNVKVPGSGMKNRYRSIIPNEVTRVHLPEAEDNPLSGYINANYIRGYGGKPHVFIATQGPLSNTVTDFWRLIWHEKVSIIVMVTKLQEKNRAKCELYLPEDNTTDCYGNIKITVNHMSEADGYMIRDISIQREDEVRHLVHYWYTAWPDHKTPEMARQLLGLVKDVELRRQNMFLRAPVVVHCSAGIGRTGCFIATSIGIEQLRNDGCVDILGIICQMRQDRGGMIQTNEQYEFVYQALALFERELPLSAEQQSTNAKTWMEH